MYRAILQVADTGPLLSLLKMLKPLGFQCYLPNEQLKRALRNTGCDNVTDIKSLVENWGYDPPPDLPEAGTSLMGSCDLFIDVKAHRNGPKVWKLWPRLQDRTLWYRINGGEPQHVINARGNHGDEINPPCPVLTPNQWYAYKYQTKDGEFRKLKPVKEYTLTGWANKSYAFWPQLADIKDYGIDREYYGGRYPYENPLCLIHGVDGWGFKELIKPLKEMGVLFHGTNSPDGMIRHGEVIVRLAKSICMVHLKNNDAPGYAMLEAMASGCPLVVPKSMIWRCKMEDLLIPNETCLTFHRNTHESLTEQDVKEGTEEIAKHIHNLHNKEYNDALGQRAKKRLIDIMWSSERDLTSLKDFFKRNFKWYD